MIILEAILNRLRGTGNIFSISKLNITGTMIYALYIFGLVFILSFIENATLPNLIIEFLNSYNIYLNRVENYFYISLFGTFLFLIGESFAFGKWVGFLVDYEDKHTPEYDSKVGKSFPYIHYMANSIVKEKDNYKLYCQVALAIRGFIWWTPLLLLLGQINALSWYQVIINSIILAIGFPFACYVGRNWTFEYKSKYFFTKQGWENQEIVYGAIQFLCVTFSIILFAIIK